MTDTPEPPTSSTGTVLATSVRRLREAQRLTYVELSERLTKVGRPIPVLGLRRIERGDRRVDVDDLFALAYVFGVTPLALLVDLGETRASLTDRVQVLPYELLMWLLGRREPGQRVNLDIGEYRPPGMAWGLGYMQVPALLALQIDDAWAEVQFWHQQARRGDVADAGATLSRHRESLRTLLGLATSQGIAAIPSEITDYLAAHEDAEETAK